MSSRREVAKFACGAEAFHAFVHGLLWVSGTHLTVFGITQTPTWHGLGVGANTAIALLLGLYAWGSRRPQALEPTRPRVERERMNA